MKNKLLYLKTLETVAIISQDSQKEDLLFNPLLIFKIL